MRPEGNLIVISFTESLVEIPAAIGQNLSQGKIAAISQHLRPLCAVFGQQFGRASRYPPGFAVFFRRRRDFGNGLIEIDIPPVQTKPQPQIRRADEESLHPLDRGDFVDIGQ